MQQLLKELNIDLILFDLDDTLLETHSMFSTCIGSLKERLAVLCNCTIDVIDKEFEACVLEARQIHYVNPTPLWTLVLELLSKLHPEITREIQIEALQTINREIYQRAVPLKQGALELLEELALTDIPIGIVTNASEEWTAFKILEAGLNNYFRTDSIIVIPPHIRKGLNDWQRAMQLHGVTPENTLIIGDNIKADIKPAVELGAIAIYFNGGHNWSVHSEGLEDLDRSRVIAVSNLLDIPAALEDYKERKLPPVA